MVMGHYYSIFIIITIIIQKLECSKKHLFKWVRTLQMSVFFIEA